MNLVLWMLIISVAINLFMFFPAYIFKTDKLTDISYAITFIVVALSGYIFSQKSVVQFIGLILVVSWALRLGFFLFIRINKIKKDVRFDNIRENFYKFLRFWLLQGATVFIILIPCILLWQQSETKINWVSTLGILIFIIGLMIESIADLQKYLFNKKSTKLWIDEGIWRISRHPNYLGEILLWIGVYIFTVSSIPILQAFFALIGPIYITVLLLFVSGVPLLEKSGDYKWGRKKAYKKYKLDVPVLLPTFSSFRRIFINKY